MVLILGSAPPAQAVTTTQLNVVLVTQLTSWSYPPQRETYEGSGVDSDLKVWSFTETISYDHWLGYGPFSMQAGADELSGTVRKTPNWLPAGGYDLEYWSYTVTGGQGEYAGCTGRGAPVRKAVTPLLLEPSTVVVSEIAFDLTCP